MRKEMITAAAVVPLTVACVEHGDYQRCGALYVRRLQAMVARHLSGPFRFVCLTDDPDRHQCATVKLTPGRAGWWNKLELFRPGLFEGRVLYIDLDDLVLGPLDPLVAAKGIIHLDDWGWTRFSYCSSVMVWDAGEHSEAWKRADQINMADFHGDQDWLTTLGGWDALPATLCHSYKYHGRTGPPPGCRVLCFHGPTKPHNLPAGHWALPFWG